MGTCGTRELILLHVLNLKSMCMAFTWKQGPLHQMLYDCISYTQNVFEGSESV